MADLFSEARWIGEFFLPGSHENRFSGEIHYSPAEGVILSYSITGQDVPAVTDVLHGILSTGDKCTLIGQFSPAQAGTNFRTDLITRSGKTGFQFLTIGDFLDHDEQFADIDFSLTNLQEFFYPRGAKDLVKYSEIPLYSVTTPFGKMEVYNAATFGYLHSDISSRIYSRDPVALDALSQAFKDIEAKYPQASFMIKEDIAYRISFEFAPRLTIRDAYRHIISLSNLFAILIYSPVYPECINLNKPGTDNLPITIQICPSMVLDPRTINLLNTRNYIHQHMPITQSTVPFDSIVSTWMQEPQSHSTIVSSIQKETGFRNEHSAHGEIVLFATQLESISFAAGKRDKPKYEYPLEKYACQRVRDRIMKAFGKATVEETAKAIGELRNEMAHVGRPKQRLATLTLRELVQISRYLQLTIIGYILTNIGVPTHVIIAYQERYCSDE